MIGSVARFGNEVSLSEWRELINRVNEELEQLDAELSGVKPLFVKLANRDPDEIEMRAAALSVHAFYNGIENVFLLIAKHY